MGLASALSTALTGLNAAETTIDVVGNNVANSNTVGFKSSTAVFATQFLQTQSLGSAPTTNSGGNNPRQIGLGTQVAEITPDFTQGTIEISANPSDLAIQGDGFFVVQGLQGGQLYTRNGIFKTNSQNELVTINGQRLLGHGIDTNFQIVPTSLVPLTIPLGAAAVAQATQNVFLEGTLRPTGDLADTAEIIQSGVLGDAAFSAPPAGTTAALAAIPDALTAGTTATGVVGAGTLTPGSTHIYRIVFADRPAGVVPDTESLASVDVSVTLGAGENEVSLTNIPVDGAGNYGNRRIYRSDDGGATFNFLTEINDNVTTTIPNDDGSIVLGAALNQDALTGNYSYYVTYSNATGGPGFGIESRPTPLIGPVNIVNGRIQLNNIPVDGTGQWSVRRIYRNLATDNSTFHFVAEIPNNLPGQSFTDRTMDATIMANPQIDFDGPKINSNTLLTNVLSRSGPNYDSVFQATGALEFAGTKGGREPIIPTSLTVTSTTTVLDLINFVEESLGIQEPPGFDPINPIPSDITGANPGGLVTTGGRIQFTGNNGVGNQIDIKNTAFNLTTSTGTEDVNLPFGSIQSAVGESASTDFLVYDTLGIEIDVRVTVVKESQDSTSTTYRWFADSPQNDPPTGSNVAVGTGLIRFDGEGKLSNVTDATVTISRSNISSESPLEFELDFSQISGLATTTPSTLAASRQDGSGAGSLASFIIGEDGRIRGVFSNGVTRDLGQIRLARFANPTGLEQRGQNLFSAGVNSGLPIEGDPGQQGIGQIIAGAVELSNTDIGENLIDLILASTQYRGNTRVITAAQQLLEELLNLRR